MSKVSYHPLFVGIQEVLAHSAQQLSPALVGVLLRRGALGRLFRKPDMEMRDTL